jgi:tripartite motif-containing protein 2/3
MFALCRTSHGSAVQQLLRALCAVAEGADVCSGVGSAHLKTAAALCVSAVLGDACRRLSTMGGREGLPRSLGSVLGCWVVRFLGGFRGVESRVIPTRVSQSISYGVAITRNGDTLLAVVSQGFHVFSVRSGAHLRAVGTPGVGPLQFRSPMQICVASDDHVFVADCGNNRVQELTPEFDFHGFIGTGQLRDPVGVCADGGIVAVAEYFRCRISVFRRGDGALLRRFGSAGSGDGQLKWPQGICFMNTSSRIAVADYYNKRICVFRADGEFVHHYGAGQLHSPIGVACSVSGDELAVADIGGFCAPVLSSSDEMIRTVRGKFIGVAMHGDAIYAQTCHGGCVVFN